MTPGPPLRRRRLPPPLLGGVFVRDESTTRMMKMASKQHRADPIPPSPPDGAARDGASNWPVSAAMMASVARSMPA